MKPDHNGGDSRLEILFERVDVDRRVGELGREIGEFYRNGDLLLVGLLKGSFIFLADLCRNINRPHKVDFIRVSSYGDGKSSSGNPQLLERLTSGVRGKDVLLVEDIIDTGNTLNSLAADLRSLDPASLEICTLLHKRKAEALDLKPRFVGFDAPDRFLVGYGLDLGESWRHLPYVAAVKE